MKKLLSIILIISLSILLSSCSRPPLDTSQTNNENYQVDFLFEHEGCKAYRFKDAGTHYYVNCHGNSATSDVEVMYTGPSGATAEVQTSIQTFYTNF